MRRSNRPLSHVKDKGEWGEVAFRAKALALGLRVATPSGENQPYDLIVTNTFGKLLRVQIKTGWCTHHGSYPIRCMRHNRAYGKNDMEVVAIYIAPHDAWYVMPPSAIPPGGFPKFYPHKPGHAGRNEKWRNRWSLITGDPEDDTRDHGLTIHAAAAE